MSWAIEVALESASVDRVIVSTEDPGLAEIANLYNAEVYDRPAGLATDTVGVHQVIQGRVEDSRLVLEGTQGKCPH